jgi:hypothetical protein
MQLLVENESVRLELIEKGKIQRQKFSWDKSAERFWECIKNGMPEEYRNAKK